MTKEIHAINTRALDFVVELIEYIFEYPDDDYMTMECLCRKLVKHGLLDKADGYYQTHEIRTDTHECVKDTHGKTESSSEKPNNCEPTPWCKYCQRRWENNCVGVAQCIRDMQMIAELYKASEDEPQTDPLPKAINGVNISDAVAWADKWLEDNPVSEMWDMIRTLRDATEWQDEPRTNADQHTQDVGSVGSVEQTEAWQEPFETDCSWK